MPQTYKDLTYSELSVLNRINIAEADGDASGKFDVLMIKPGLSLNDVFYSEQLLEAAVNNGLFDNVRSLVRTDSEHMFGEGKTVRNIIGLFSNTRFVEGQGVVGTLTITPDARWLAEKLQFSLNQARPNLLGFSIVGEGLARRDTMDGRSIRIVETLTGISFVDVVVDPGAGGQVLSMTEGAALGNYLQQQIDSGKTTLPKLATAAGISDSTMGQIIRGEIETPPEDRLQGFASELGVSLDTIKGFVPGSKKMESQEAKAYAEALSNHFESPEGKGDWDEEYREMIEAAKLGNANLEVISLSEAVGISEQDVLRNRAQKLDPYTETNKMRSYLLKMIETHRPAQYKLIDKDSITEAQLQAMVDVIMAEGSAAPTAVMTEAVPTVVAPAPVPGMEAWMAQMTAQSTQLNEALAAITMDRAKLTLTESLNTSGLPEAGQSAVREVIEMDIAEGRVPTSARIAALVASQKKLFKTVGQAGVFQGEGQTYHVEMRESTTDKAVDALYAFFENDPEKPAITSFKEAYIRLTGDANVAARPKRANIEALTRYAESKGLMDLTEAINTTTSVDIILQDAINKKMVAEYTRVDLGQWRMVSQRETVSDFRTQHITRWGGYSDLAVVAEGAVYLPLTSPGNEEATYAVAKRGGTETLTWEVIRNDDARFIRQIPIRMGRAASQTLHEFVFDFWQLNPNIYDATAYFTVGHANLGTAAFSKAEWLNGRKEMRKQTELTSGKALSIRPDTLMGPVDLEDAFFDAFTAGIENKDDAAFNFRPTRVLTLEDWTDSNDWVQLDSRNPGLLIGFLDQEAPQVLVQNNATVGSMFDTDQWTYRIRHTYGATIQDFRSARKYEVV